jgi:glycine oxidase
MSDVVIIGGGIVGLACAYECAKARASVTLLEYGKTGMQATNAAAGMLAPLSEALGPGPMFDIGVQALAEFPALVADMESQVDFGIELQLDAILKVAFTQDQFEELRARRDRLTAAGHELELLDAAQCREAEPRMSDRIIGALYSPNEGSINNQLLALALERAAMAHGAVIRQRAPALGFRASGERIVSVRTADEDVAGDTFVIAAGARSAQIAAKLSHPRLKTANRRPRLPIRPIRGQMIALGGMSTPIRSIVWGPDGYLVPRANGIVFAGATVEDVGFRRRTTQRGMRQLRSMANTLVPQLSAAQHLFEWAGLRPATPDGMPIIGPAPGLSHVIIASGHYRNGILLGPITGRMVADGITRGDWAGVPTEFWPSRFA